MVYNYLGLFAYCLKFGFKKQGSGFLNATAYNAKYILETYFEMITSLFISIKMVVAP